MIVFRCDHCGVQIGERLQVAIRPATVVEQHFCSIHCAIPWAEWAGYYKQRDPDCVVDAEIYCGVQSTSGSDCKFTDGHPGPHVTNSGQAWQS